MKLRLLIVGVFVLVARTSFAQGGQYLPPLTAADSSNVWIFSKLETGPFFSGGVSRMNEQVTPSWETAPEFAYAFGWLVEGSLSSWFGVNFAVSYEARALHEATNDGSRTADLSLSYVGLTPSIRIFWLMIGIAIDLPMAGSATLLVKDLYGPGKDYSENRNVETTDLESGVALRGGLTIPIYHVEGGVVSATLVGEYPLQKVLAGTASIDTTSTAPFHEIGRGPLPSVQAGISYKFDVMHLN